MVRRARQERASILGERPCHCGLLPSTLVSADDASASNCSTMIPVDLVAGDERCVQNRAGNRLTINETVEMAVDDLGND